MKCVAHRGVYLGEIQLQDIRTTEGSTYELEFYTIDAFRNYKTSNETQVHVEVQSPTGTTLIDEAIAVMGSAFEPVDGSWSFAGPFPFQASSENTRIYFYAGGSACPMLDNVRVRVTKEAETTTTEAPETTPSTTTMARSSSDTAAAATAKSIATAEAALKAGATAAATVLRNGGKAHEQSLAAANAAAAVFVTDHPTAEIPEAHPTERPFTSTTHKLWKNACPDKTRAPRGTWVVYNLSSTPILHSCLVKPMKDRDCSCSFQDVYTPGCYRASDPVPGTAWFIVVAGCDCTDHKARCPGEFNLPPMEQNVGAADVLNVGPEEAARALNRQRQQLTLGELEHRQIADAIFGMDTGEIPEKATQRMLDAAVQDAASAKYAINATVSVMGHALSTLKSGKPLADAVFGGDTSHLIQPHVAPSEAGAPGDLHLPKNRFKGKFPDFKKKEEPVETLRFSGDFKAICSECLAPVRCVDVKAGSVMVTLEAESWDELEQAHAKINKESGETVGWWVVMWGGWNLALPVDDRWGSWMEGTWERREEGLKLPSFGSLEKQEVKEGDSKTGEMTAEEKKEDLLNPESWCSHQSFWERSNSDSVIGVSVAVFGFACVGLCIYSCIRARSRVKQKLGSAVSKRLMKRAQVGDTQLVITNIDDLKVGDEVLLGKEKITIKEIAIAVTLSNGLAKACQSGDAVALSDEGSGGGGALSKDVVEGEKELRVTKMPQLKKGDVLKVGANEKVTVKSISKLLTISPALKSAHIIGTKIQKPGETATDTEVGEPDSPTAASAAAASETEPEGTVSNELMTLRRLRLQVAGVLALLCGWRVGQAWLFPQAGATRREVLGLAGLGAMMQALAGKYSTIPSGKRRFYGRVRQGLYEYLKMEPAIKAGDLKATEVEEFFSMNIVKVKGGMPMKNCGFGGNCVTKEKRTSRWLDFKTATDLLASVKVIRAFAKKVTRMEEAIQEGNVKEVQQLYAKSKLDLTRYLPLVELEPLDSEDYTHEWDTRPQVWCQGQFCRAIDIEFRRSFGQTPNMAQPVHALWGLPDKKSKSTPPKCFNIASRVQKSSIEQPLSCRVHPVTVLKILDAYVRRPAGATRTIGTLLGWISEGSAVDITDSFPVPHKDTTDEGVAIDQDYHKSMLELRQKVSPREVVVGWFSTGDEINATSAFNAITGLNGSGKSNILDAICFVLGISNLTQVRVGNLSELVYKQGQAGVTKASVTIVFNNEDKQNSPVGYEMHDKIIITRQIVIGGRNRYLLNSHNVQQNQIQNLFHSVSLNVNNPHFLIMQGRITKVINMKPQETLSMIEEAAGTRMYENKKAVALKTLEKKQNKVEEINRLLSEEITPTLEKLWVSNNNEIERLERFCVAYEYESLAQIAQSTKDLTSRDAAIQKEMKQRTASRDKARSQELKRLEDEHNKLSKER
eukprot:g19666.t1